MTDQTAFYNALFDASRPVPEGITDPQGRPAPKRFAVYRNNVAVSLTRALEDGFPVVRKLVGDVFFTAMAGVYLRAHPPKSPVLSTYGEEMPAFLRAFAPVAHLPYLPDIARLDLARRRAYHAADCTAVTPSDLMRLTPAALNAARFQLAPATELIRSPHPIHGIWRYTTTPGSPKPVQAPENVLITRPVYDPIVTPVSAPQAVFVTAVRDGQSLSQELLRVAPVPGEFDLTETLGLLFQTAALAATESYDHD